MKENLYKMKLLLLESVKDFFVILLSCRLAVSSFFLSSVYFRIRISESYFFFVMCYSCLFITPSKGERGGLPKHVALFSKRMN